MSAHFQKTSKHWDEFSGIRAALAASGRCEPKILALLATETYFRSTIHRVLEYLYWIVIDAINPARADFISLGISQAQVHHWRRAGIVSQTSLRISTLARFWNPFLNYDVCNFVLSTNMVNTENMAVILRAYTGRVTRYHLSVFAFFFQKARRDVEVIRSCTL